MNGLADYAWVAPETPLPVAVTDDTNRVCAGLLIIFRRYRPPQRRVDTKHRIVVPGHELPTERRFWLPIHTHGQPQRVVSQDAGERLVLISESFVALVKEAGVSPAIPAERCVREHDELLRVFDWQTFQEDCIHDTEDCRVGPDAQRQQEHGNAGKARITP